VPRQILRGRYTQTGRTEVLRRSNPVIVDPGYLSAPEAVEFLTEGGRTAHAFFYLPHAVKAGILAMVKAVKP
jgi:hypothetical protein